MDYAAATKTSRMTAVRDNIDAGAGAGKLKIGTASMASVLATITLNDPSGTIAGTPAVLTLSGFPKSDTSADNTGKAVAAIITDSDDNSVIISMTVGLNSTVAPAWAGTTAYTAGQFVTNGANQYKCTTGGTSAGSGGPTGTGTGITDNTVTWDYYSPAGADVQMDNLEINATQTVTVSSAAFTHA